MRRVRIIFKTHLDIGFTDLAVRVVERYFRDFIVQAVKTAEYFRRGSGAFRYRWTVGSWLIDEYFNRAYDFIKGLDVSQLHVFTYSERPGTQALKIGHVVPPEEKHQRCRRLLDLSEQKFDAFYSKHVGQTMEVLLETRQSDGWTEGYTTNYLPVKVKDAGTAPGQLLRVHITGVEGHICTGVPL